jgi:hypothetical protein
MLQSDRCGMRTKQWKANASGCISGSVQMTRRSRASVIAVVPDRVGAGPLRCHDLPFKVVADHPGLVRPDSEHFHRMSVGALLGLAETRARPRSGCDQSGARAAIVGVSSHLRSAVILVKIYCSGSDDRRHRRSSPSRSLMAARQCRQHVSYFWLEAVFHTASTCRKRSAASSPMIACHARRPTRSPL